jgi:DNA-binding NarL/FixJ family response regulator
LDHTRPEPEAAAHRVARVAVPSAAVLVVGKSPCQLALVQGFLPEAGNDYEVVSLGCEPEVSAVAHLLATAPPRLVLADILWCQDAGSGVLRQLRQESPGTGWIVCWSSPEPRWLPLLLDCGALGALPCDASPQEQLQALDAVRAGELWLPRKVLQWLYVRLLDAGAAGPVSVHGGAKLTAREAEVMALLHKGLTNREISVRLRISVSTVKKHLGSGFEKLGILKRRQVLG